LDIHGHKQHSKRNNDPKAVGPLLYLLGPSDRLQILECELGLAFEEIGHEDSVCVLLRLGSRGCQAHCSQEVTAERHRQGYHRHEVNEKSEAPAVEGNAHAVEVVGPVSLLALLAHRGRQALDDEEARDVGVQGA